jgi:hypothetical protein
MARVRPDSKYSRIHEAANRLHQHIESKGEPQDCFGAPEGAEPSGKKSGPAQIMELTWSSYKFDSSTSLKD